MRGHSSNSNESKQNSTDEEASDDEGRNSELERKLNDRAEIRDQIENFSLKKLIRCRKDIEVYVKQYGENPPVYTRYTWLNRKVNYTLSLFRIPTNQRYANAVLLCINEAKSEIKKYKSRVKENKELFPRQKKINESVRYEVEAVHRAVQNIYIIHEEMVHKKIFGRVRHSIEKILYAFDFLTEESILKINCTINKLKKVDITRRMETPIRLTRDY